MAMARQDRTGPDKATRGQAGEALACRYLCDRGLRLLVRNFRCRMGELDLVMQDGPERVFVEVRSRRAGRHGTPLESITAAKRQRLLRAAAYYLQRHGGDVACRFDVVGITHAPDGVHIEWVRDAFRAE